MHDLDRFRLLHGPYRMPRRRVVGWLKCLVRGRVKVQAISDGPIPWPMTRQHENGGGHLVHILCGDLARAVQSESQQAVMHWWGISHATAWKWRKAHGVAE